MPWTETWLFSVDPKVEIACGSENALLHVNSLCDYEIPRFTLEHYYTDFKCAIVVAKATKMQNLQIYK